MTFDLKKTAMQGAAAGVAIVFFGATLFAVVHWFTSRPKGWDTSSIHCTGLTVVQTLTDVEATARTPEHFEGSGFRLEFVVENTTRSDYTVPADLTLFLRQEPSSALTEIKAKLDHPYVIPANERAEVNADVEYSCGTFDMATGSRTERPVQQCFDEEFGHVSGLVAFDYATHTRIDIPKPTLFKGSGPQPKDSSAPTNDDPGFRPAKPIAAHGPWENYQKRSWTPTSKAPLTAPDKGDRFDRVAACMIADELAPRCTAQHFAPHTGGYAAYDGWQTPLPQLPQPPAGYRLDPNAGVCDASYQWKNYCSANKMN